MATIPLFYLGALASYVTHPQVWLVAGPFRLAALLWATVTQESGWNPDAYNPERQGSAGLAQFQPDSFEDVAPDAWTVYPNEKNSDDARFSPMKVGYAAVSYIAAGIVSDFGWLAIRLPGYGYPLLRLMWRAGIGSFERAGSLSAAKAQGDAYVEEESKGTAAWDMASKVAMGATLIAVLIAGAIAYKRRGRR